MKKYAQQLLDFTADCRDDMHEPDEQGFKRVSLVGDHLDNAFGNTIIVGAITGCYQEYVLIIERDTEEHGKVTLPINLANLIALARIGARTLSDQDRS
jgi:hypothetical protein